SGNIYGATWASRDYCCQWTPSWGGTYDTATTYATGRVESSGVSPLPVGFSSGWVTWDLTALAQGWVDGVIENDGILVKSRYPGDITYKLEFLTKENNSVGGTHRPQLVVVYQ
ncbi:MAG TPA: DNRLRE domain-containing protein, partial [Burkholderiales bacterium]|nr:DNRLRE domain-containing protein [Burkholderiales bacterium]